MAAVIRSNQVREYNKVKAVGVTPILDMVLFGLRHLDFLYRILLERQRAAQEGNHCQEGQWKLQVQHLKHQEQ